MMFTSSGPRGWIERLVNTNFHDMETIEQKFFHYGKSILHSIWQTLFRTCGRSSIQVGLAWRWRPKLLRGEP